MLYIAEKGLPLQHETDFKGTYSIWHSIFPIAHVCIRIAICIS